MSRVRSSTVSSAARFRSADNPDLSAAGASAEEAFVPIGSSPETSAPGGMSNRSSTSPVSGSMRRMSLALPSQVPCQSSPSTGDAGDEAIAVNCADTSPVSGSHWWILRPRCWPTQSRAFRPSQS